MAEYEETAGYIKHIAREAKVKMPIATEIENAKNLVNVQETLKQRGSNYGNFNTHADLTQNLKKVFYYHFEKYNSQGLTGAESEALDMIFHKLGRIGNGNPHYKDSWLDIAGYAMLIANELED